MIEQFEEGETYTNSKYDQDIMVLAVAEDNDDDVWLAVLWVDRESYETTHGDELQILKADFDDWSRVEI